MDCLNNLKLVMKMKLNMKTKLILTGITATVMLLDNITTLFAIWNNAIELNPLVRVFLSNMYMYAAFTVFKMLVMSYIAYRYVNTLKDAVAWLIVMLIFIRAIIINIMNAW